MKLEVFLPSQAKPDLNAKPGLSSSAQGDVSGGKNSSFLQILRPKTGLSDKPVSNDRVESKTKVSGTALHHTASTGRPSREANRKTTDLFEETVARPSQALKKSKKQSEEQSAPTVTLGQASQHVVSKATLKSSKKQTGSLSGNSPKTNFSSVGNGQADKASRKVAAGDLSTVSAKQETGLKLQKASTLNAHGIAFGVEKGAKNTAKTEPVSDKKNNPLARGKIVQKTRANSLPSSAGSNSDTLRAGAATDRIQNKRASGIAAIPKAPNRSAGNGARISERISKTKTTTWVSAPDPITAKKSISAERIVQGASSTPPRQINKTVSSQGEQNDPYGKANVTKLAKSTRLQRIVGKAEDDKTQNARLLPELKPSKAANLQSASSSVNSIARRSEKSEAIKSFSSKDVLNRGAQDRKTATHLKPPVAQNPQQLEKVSPTQSQKYPVNGVKIKSDAPNQANIHSSTLIEKTAKGNQFLGPDAVTRRMAIAPSRERIPNQNSPSAPDIRYPVKESMRQLNMSEAQKSKDNSLHGTTAQLTGLQMVVASKINSVLTGEKQMKPFKVAAKPSQRPRKLDQAAPVRKPAKRTIAQTKADAGVAKANVAGMEDAFFKSDMNLARKMEQPGNPRQNLPYGEQFVSREVRNHASVAAEMIEAGRSDLPHIRDVAIRNDFVNRLNQADVDLQSLQAKSTQTKGQTSVNAIVYRQVMSAVETFRGMNTSRWAMTIEPFHNLRIQLDLRMSDSRLVVQAKLERGSQAVLGNGWSELQASLAEKDVDLRSLITGSQKEGHSYMSGGKNERQSDGSNRDEESWFSEELSELLAEFEKEAQVPGKAKRNRRKARMAETNFESWA